MWLDSFGCHTHFQKSSKYICTILYIRRFFPYLPSCTLDRCRHYWFCAHAHVPWGHGFAGKVRCILGNHMKTSLLHGPWNKEFCNNLDFCVYLGYFKLVLKRYLPSNDRPGQNYLKNACHIPRKPRVCFHQNHVQPCVSEIGEEKYNCTKINNNIKNRYYIK